MPVRLFTPSDVGLGETPLKPPALVQTLCTGCQRQSRSSFDDDSLAALSSSVGSSSSSINGSKSVQPLVSTSTALLLLLLLLLEANLGEMEVRDALHAKAVFLADIGDREAAAAAFKITEEKTASGASKADMVFCQIR
jgi:hypothetical protein